MHAIIDPNSLAEMTSSLENHELGAAVRLLSRIVTSGRTVPLARARTVCQMTEEAWEVSGEEILSHFVLGDGRVGHRALDEARIPPVASRPKVRVGVTADMPIVHPTKDNRVPAYISRDKPEIISMKRTAYIMMTEIFARSDQSENTARALLASLLKNWPEGDVYEAISAAGKQQYIVDPRGWIVKHLQRTSRPIVAARSRRETCPPPERKPIQRELVTPEAMGVSTSTAQKIRDRNANLRLDIGTRSQNQ